MTNFNLTNYIAKPICFLKLIHQISYIKISLHTVESGAACPIHFCKEAGGARLKQGRSSILVAILCYDDDNVIITCTM